MAFANFLQDHLVAGPSRKGCQRDQPSREDDNGTWDVRVLDELDDVDVAAPAMDLTYPSQGRLVQVVADGLNSSLLARAPDVEAAKAEAVKVAGDRNYKDFTQLVMKLAISKHSVSKLFQPVHNTVVFVVYGEQNRILPKTEHQNGEDFVRIKLDQMQWLFGDGSTPSGHSWDFVVCDDGCPNRSGRLVQEVASTHPLGSKIKVIYLQDAIDQQLLVASGLKTTDDRAPFSTRCGMPRSTATTAAANTARRCRLLLDLLLRQGKLGAVGSRRADDAVCNAAGRKVRGQLTVYMWKQMFPELCHITETQTAFKALVRDLASL